MSHSQVESVRAASRHLVRELKVLSGCGYLPGLSFSECHVLTELERRGRLTASDLADTLVLEKSTVSRLVNGLRRRKLITSEDNPGDRRQRPLVLTDEGRNYSGIVAGEDAARLLLRVAGQEEPVSIPKSIIESREIAPVSMMPAGLLATLKDQEVLDLVAYLQSREQVPEAE